MNKLAWAWAMNWLRTYLFKRSGMLLGELVSGSRVRGASHESEETPPST